jgi:hypothetical protein
MRFGESEFEITREDRQIQFLSLSPHNPLEIERRVMLDKGTAFPLAYDSKGSLAAVTNSSAVRILSLESSAPEASAREIASIAAELTGDREIKGLSFSRDASKLAIRYEYGFVVIGPSDALLVDNFADLAAYRD